MAKKQDNKAEDKKTSSEQENKNATATTIKKKFASLSDYKKKNNLNNTKFKPQEWLELSPAFQEATGVKGLPSSGVTLVRGHSDSGKSTAIIEAAISAQKKGILPIFIISEMKWSWEHAKLMGLEFEEILDEKTKEVVSYDGFFIYVDRSKLKTIEDVAEFINSTLDDQEAGKLNYDLVFFWDSVGSLPCRMAVEKKKNNNEWNAGAMSVQFGGSINQRIAASKKEDSPFTNALICVNKVWTQKPENIMAQPRMENKGGKTMWYDAVFIVTFGNVTSSGINKIKVTKNGREITFASRVKVQIEKNHVNGVSTTSKVIVTPTGYIADDKKAIEKYQKEHMPYFISLLGGTEDDEMQTVIEEEEERLNTYDSEPGEPLE